jgi:uncharacterized protein with HEPN domain
MLSDRTGLVLADIRDNIGLALNFAAGMSPDTFAADRRTWYAVTRCFEIVSEAARRLPPSLRGRHPEVPWRAIMGAGNIYCHDYDVVVAQIVWQTVTRYLEPLLAVVEAELAGADKKHGWSDEQTALVLYPDR